MKKVNQFTGEDIETSIEWAKDNLSLSELNERWGYVPSPSVYIKLARHLKEAVLQGYLRIIKIKK
mgnify:CR=1 FL=1